MFTGLIQAVGAVASITPTPAPTPDTPARALRLLIDPKGWRHRPTPGDSIAINGCCLTLAAIELSGADNHWAFDIIPETLSKTTLGLLVPGSPINLEHAATPTTLLGGHIVQGHIDGVGVVESLYTVGEHRLRIRPPTGFMQYTTPRGSVCIEGVSLTIATLEPHQWFDIALIPTTLEKTTLGTLRPGSRVNLEVDAFAKTVVHYLRHYTTPYPHLTT